MDGIVERLVAEVAAAHAGTVLSASHQCLRLLAEGVPLPLLMDLAGAGPASDRLYGQERADLGWLRPAA